MKLHPDRLRFRRCRQKRCPQHRAQQADERHDGVVPHEALLRSEGVISAQDSVAVCDPGHCAGSMPRATDRSSRCCGMARLKELVDCRLEILRTLKGSDSFANALLPVPDGHCGHSTQLKLLQGGRTRHYRRIGLRCLSRRHCARARRPALVWRQLRVAGRMRLPEQELR